MTRADLAGATALAFAILGGVRGTAWAGDPPPAEAPAGPKYGADDMALTPKSILPKGWALLADEAARPEAEIALAAAAAAAAKSAQADPEALHVVTRSIASPAGKTATAMLLDADESSEAVAMALESAAKKGGWAFRRMGAPSRLLVVAAPADARDAIVAAQLKWAAVGLSQRAFAVYNAPDPHGCTEICRVALTFDPKSAPAHHVAKVPAWGLVYVKNKKGPFPEAIAHLRAALAPDASYPLSKTETGGAQRHLAMCLLLQGGGATEARDIIQPMLKDPASLSKEDYSWCRYNLACAFGQLGQKEEPFRLLTELLAENVKEPQWGIEGWREDEDFKLLHADPRWKALLEKYPEDDGSGK